MAPHKRIAVAATEREKRELRMRIARLRRQIDGDVRDLRDERTRLTSWRTYVSRYPAAALGLAFGVGMTASAGLSPRRVSRWLGTSLATAALGSLRAGLLDEISRFWRDVSSGSGGADG